MATGFEFECNGKTFQVSFQKRNFKIEALVRKGLLQNPKSKTKFLESSQDERGCVICRISEPNASSKTSATLAVGMSVCSPRDKFVAKEGQKISITRAIKRARDMANQKGDKTVLDPDTTVYLWDAFHRYHTPKPLETHKS